VKTDSRRSERVSNITGQVTRADSLIGGGYDDNRLVTTAWTARYPDLTGKAVIVAGDSPAVIDVTRAFAANGAMIAIVSGNRDVVDQSLQAAEELGAAVMGMTTDPTSASAWQRLASHIEQRLGPIDVAVVVGPASMRRVVGAALLGDMAARARGVFIEVDDVVASVRLAAGVRHRALESAGVASGDLAALTLVSASDTIAASTLRLSFDQAAP
jgi:hypothetical protein